MIARAYRGDIGSRRLDDTGAFVAEHEGSV